MPVSFLFFFFPFLLFFLSLLFSGGHGRVLHVSSNSLRALRIEQLVLELHSAIGPTGSLGGDRLADVAGTKQFRDQVGHLNNTGRPVARDEKKSRLIFG